MKRAESREEATCNNCTERFSREGALKNKIALEEHFAIAGTKKCKNDVMDAPTFAEVNRRLFDTESLRLEAIDKAGIGLCSFF